MATKTMSAAYGGVIGVLLGAGLGAVLGGKRKRMMGVGLGALGGAAGGAGVGYVMGTEEKKKGTTSNVQPTSGPAGDGGDTGDTGDVNDPGDLNDPGTAGTGGSDDPLLLKLLEEEESMLGTVGRTHPTMEAVLLRPGLRSVTMSATGSRNARRR